MIHHARHLQWLAIAAFGIGVSGCAGLQTSNYAYNDSYKTNVPVKAADCYDASVLLGKSLADSTAIANKALVAVDAKVLQKTESQIKAERNRQIGLFVGSGGEELLVAFKPVAADKTFVTVATKTGFVGGAGQKAWSCQIADQMVAMASK